MSETTARVFCMCCGSTKKPIDLHHIIHRSQGGTDDPSNLGPLCRECHEKHHHEGGGRITFYRAGDVLMWERMEGAQKVTGRCRFYDEAVDPDLDDDMTPQDGDDLQALKGLITQRVTTANTASWATSQDLLRALKVFQRHHESKTARTMVTEWAGEMDIPPATVSKMLATAILPDADIIHVMPLSRRYNVVRALKKTGVGWEDVIDDAMVLSDEDFCAKWLDKPTRMDKDACECPTCGKIHPKKEEK
jgi:hypothetical protein